MIVCMHAMKVCVTCDSFDEGSAVSTAAAPVLRAGMSLRAGKDGQTLTASRRSHSHLRTPVKGCPSFPRSREWFKYAANLFHNTLKAEYTAFLRRYPKPHLLAHAHTPRLKYTDILVS
jgi:hypothetical protein